MKLANLLFEATKVNISNLTWRQFVAKYTTDPKHGGAIKNGFELQWYDDHEGNYLIADVGEDELDENKVAFGAEAHWFEGKWQYGDYEAPTDVNNKQYTEDWDAKVDSLFTLTRKS